MTPNHSVILNSAVPDFLIVSFIKLLILHHHTAMLARLLLKGRVAKATAIVNGEAVKTVPSPVVDQDFIGEYMGIIGQILRIKKSSDGKQKIFTCEGALGKTLKLEPPYDRLVLCR